MVCHHFWVGATANQQQAHPKMMKNMLKKVFNWSKVHLSEVTFYKIHTLTFQPDIARLSFGRKNSKTFDKKLPDLTKHASLES